MPEEGMPEGAKDMIDVYIVATDMAYRPQSLWQFYPAEAHARSDMLLNLTLKNAGGNSYPHSLVIDELGVRLQVAGEFAKANVVLEAPAGTYTYYCDVQGHRQLGMEGTLTVA